MRSLWRVGWYMSRRITVRDVAAMKARGERIPVLTAYDYTTSRLADEAGVPIILVGDSLGMVVLGHDSTVPVTMDDMLHHIKAVARGARRALLVGDLPFMTYHLDLPQALGNAARFIQEGGAHAVKLEGGQEVAETVRRIVECGIPVMGHIGLTPQSVNVSGGYRVTGRGRQETERLLRDAVALEQAGAFSVVLELVPAPLAAAVTQRLSIPTIGIGAGPHCDGQVQVLHDMLGLYQEFVPRHTRRYAQLAETISAAFGQYMSDVKNGTFPGEQESSGLDDTAQVELQSVLEDMDRCPENC